MPEPPAWMETLVEIVGNSMELHSASGPLAFRWQEENDHWQIMVYLSPAELVGGAEDGAVVVPGFSLDVQALSAVFDELPEVRWQAQAFGPHDQEGQHISFEGTYAGHDVWLQVLSQAPEDEEPGFKVDSSGKGEG